jgi:pimeloyl-ACP methyl ester carboxylesterase
MGTTRRRLRRTFEVSCVCSARNRYSWLGTTLGLMVAYAYAAQYPAEVSKVVLMDAFLPGVGNWKDVWLLRDLWHFHFYGPTPLALVKGRERVYLEHFWNDFAADKTKSVPEADRRIYAAAYARADGMRAGFEYFKASSRTPRTSQRCRQPSWTCLSSSSRVRRPPARSSSTKRRWSRPMCPAPW